eukprot:1161975-Pelagomonas_calceolata.AAC.8
MPPPARPTNVNLEDATLSPDKILAAIKRSECKQLSNAAGCTINVDEVQQFCHQTRRWQLFTFSRPPGYPEAWCWTSISRVLDSGLRIQDSQQNRPHLLLDCKT